MSKPLLEFRGVALPLGEGSERSPPLSFVLPPGGLVWVRLPRGMPVPPILDVACGLIGTGEGSVLFQGLPWPEMSTEAADSQRGRMGRIFGGKAWMSNLDVDENIVLASIHHGLFSRAEALAAATGLARQLGLDPLPPCRPAALEARESQLGQWTRALLGRKDLFLLERPSRALDAEDLRRCVSLLSQRLAEGAAALVVEPIEYGEWLIPLSPSLTIHANDLFP